MNNSAVLGSIAADDIIYRMKQVATPGRMMDPVGNNWVFDTGNPLLFYNVYRDNWYPQDGLASFSEFTVPIGGYYQFSLYVRFPDGGVEGVGWGNGYSGDGEGNVWLQTLRGGGVMEDNIGHQYQPFPAGANPTFNLGPFYRTLIAGDRIRAMAQCGAQGHGPKAWDAQLTMYWHVGGGGPPGPT